MRVDSGSISDVGRKRKSNEDNYCANDREGLYVVADGMGGHAAGEVASELATETIEEFIKLTSSDADITWPFGIDEKLSLSGNRLKTAIRFANGKLVEKVLENAECEGMATTVAAGLLDKDQAHIAHVGDSRVYLVRDNSIRQLTSDHSWVNEQVMSGLIDSEQARTHPLRNVVTRALGGKEGLEIDLQVLDLEAGDMLLICSDGLTSMIEDGEILEVVQAGGLQVNQVVRELVDAANKSGGEDNITTIALSFSDNQDEGAS